MTYTLYFIYTIRNKITAVPEGLIAGILVNAVQNIESHRTHRLACALWQRTRKRSWIT